MIIPIVILILIILSENKVRANINVFSPYELRAGINSCNLWKDVTRGNLEIKNKGDFSNALLANPEMKNNIQKVKIDNFITEIPSNAFNSCKKLKEVSLPYSVAVIGAGAFSNTALESIILPKNLKTIGNYAFSGTEIKVINIPENVTSIGNYAFSKTNLSEIYIPESVTSIGDYAFSGGKLKKVLFIGQNVEKIGKDVFPKDVKIYGLSGTKICEYAKKNNLEFVDILGEINIKYHQNKEEKELFTAMSLSDFVYHIEHAHILNLGGKIDESVDVGPYKASYKPLYNILKKEKTVGEIIQGWTNGIKIKKLAFNDDGKVDTIAGADIPINTYGFYEKYIKNYKYISSQYDSNSGFCGAAFEGTDDKIWIVYCGTDPANAREMYNDIVKADALELGSITGTPDQCVQALEFYKKIKKIYEKEIIITGHSLGGALATYVSALTDERSITINGANCLVVSNLIFGTRNKISDYLCNNKIFDFSLIPITKKPYEWNVVNYMTNPTDNNFVQKLMCGELLGIRIGLLDGIDAKIYAYNNKAKDTHNIFSFLSITMEDGKIYYEMPYFTVKKYPIKEASTGMIWDGGGYIWIKNNQDDKSWKIFMQNIELNPLYYKNEILRNIEQIEWGNLDSLAKKILEPMPIQLLDQMIRATKVENKENYVKIEDMDLEYDCYLLTKNITLTINDDFLDNKDKVIIVNGVVGTIVRNDQKKMTTLTMNKKKLIVPTNKLNKIKIYDKKGQCKIP